MAEVHADSGSTEDSPDGCEPVADWKGIEKELVEDIFQSEDGSNQFATPLMYTCSVGRGTRRRPDQCDIRIPQIYYDKLRHKNLSKPKRASGRGNVLRTYSSQNLPERIPNQDNIRTIDQNQHNKPLPLDENFLGAATRGLTSEILEGKACLMEKFLGKPMTDQEAFNPFGMGYHHNSNSLRSTQTAPNLNLNSTDHWPDVNSGACQSDCGQKGPGGTTYPSKSFSLQDVLKAISTSSTWEKSSQDSSRKGSRKGRRMGKKGEVVVHNVSQDKERLTISSSEGASALSAPEATQPENGSGGKNLGDWTSKNQQGAVPIGPNLIQVECLPDDITEQRLTAVMYGYGPVISCNILRDSDSQKCIGIAFVRFETSKACLSAITSLHDEDSPFHDSSDEKKIPKLLIHMVA